MKFFEDCTSRHIKWKRLPGGGTLYKVPANNEKGFNFDYYLFLPDEMNKTTTIFFESMNYKTSDNFSYDEAMEYWNTRFLGQKIHFLNQNTNYPVLYPLIPRYYDEKLKKEIYTIQLSSSCLKDDIDARYKRIDNQVVQMINDARERLKNNNFEVDNKIIVNGFSASAKFANRFALLHPDKIKMIIAGGLGGCLTLPLRELDGETLVYPVGVGNVDVITDEMLEEFKTIKQFYFQGTNDKTDAFASTTDDNYEPYFKGIIEENELKQLYKVFGRDIQDRWKKTQELYSQFNCNAIFKTYNSNHGYTDEIEHDIISFLNDNKKTHRLR